MPSIVTASVRLIVLAVFTSCLWFGGSFALAGDGKVNLNTATIEQLETLKGIGPELAKRILAYRAEHGPFTTVQELINVRGIGEKKLATIHELVTVEAADPLATTPSRPAR